MTRAQLQAGAVADTLARSASRASSKGSSPPPRLAGHASGCISISVKDETETGSTPFSCVAYTSTLLSTRSPDWVNAQRATCPDESAGWNPRPSRPIVSHAQPRSDEVSGGTFQGTLRPAHIPAERNSVMTTVPENSERPDQEERPLMTDPSPPSTLPGTAPGPDPTPAPTLPEPSRFPDPAPSPTLPEPAPSPDPTPAPQPPPGQSEPGPMAFRGPGVSL